MVKKIFKTTALLIVVFMLSACTIWIGGTRIKINEKTGEYKDKETDKEHDFAVSTEDDETPVDFSGNEIPEDDDGRSEEQRFGIAITNGATGISTVYCDTVVTSQKAPCYNLNGQRIEKPAKGIYIQNRQKIIIK